LPAVPQERVCEHDELSHDRGDGDLSGFAGVDELAVFRLQTRVEAHRDQGGHVKRLGSGLARPPRRPGSPRDLSRGVVMKARPVQRPDWRATGAKPARLAACFGLHCAQIGHFDQQGEGADAGDAGEGEQDREAAGQFGVSLDAGFDLGRDGGALPLDLAPAAGRCAASAPRG